MKADSFIVYETIRNEWKTCEYGGNHLIYIVAPKRIWPTGKSVISNNGYSAYTSNEYVDSQGRLYYKKIGIDYSDNISYLRMEDLKLFKSRRPMPSILITDL